MSSADQISASGGASPSQAAVGAAIPADADLVGGKNPSGDLTPFNTSAAGDLIVDQGAANTAANGWPVKPTDGTNSQAFTAAGEAKVDITQPLPAGTNTIGAVEQASGPWSTDLTEIAGAAPSATNPLPTRISNGTSFVDPTQIRALTSSDVVTADQGGTWDINNITGTVSLPTGAATEAEQATANTSLSAIDTNTANIPAKGQAVMAASTPVAIASDQSAIPIKAATGRSFANAPARIDYTVTNVTTSAYVQLVAPLSAAANEIEIFDSSGQTLALAVGAAGSEVVQLYIFPGGNGRVPLAIPINSRVSVKAISANAVSGEIDINFYT